MHFLFDIGGTNTRMAVTDGRRLGVVRSFKTPASFRDGVLLLRKEGSDLLRGGRAVSVSGGIAGVIDPGFGIRRYSPHLSKWIGKSLFAELRKAFRCPVLLENDAALAGLGEAHFGAGKARRIVAYLTFSTGIGGARIVKGRIDERAYGFEPGASFVDWKCGKTLEEVAGGAAVVRRVGRQPELVRSAKFWDGTARAIAYGVHNAIVFWSPDVVVLGGGMILKEPHVDMRRVQFHLRKISHVYPKLPEVKRVVLGDRSGLYGALARIRMSKSL